MKGNRKKIKYVVIAAAACIAVSAYAVYAAMPAAYQAQTAQTGPIAGSIEVTGKTEGEQETQYYAAVTAPVKTLAIKEGQSVTSGSSLLTYDTDDIENVCEEAQLSAAAIQSEYDSRMKESRKQADKHAQATADEQAYKDAYRLARSWQTEVVQGQYTQSFSLQEKAAQLEKKMNESAAQISETESKISTLTTDLTDIELDLAQQEREVASLSTDLSRLTEGTDEYGQILSELKDAEDDLDDLKDKKKEKKKKLDSESDTVSDLQSDIADLKAQLPDMTGGEMTPEENLANMNYNQYLSDVLRNLTETQTDVINSENQILNEEAKNQLLSTAQLSELKHQLAMEDLETAKAGITAEFDGIVTKLYVKENAYVAKGEPLFAIQDSSAVKVNVLLSKYDIGKVKEGQRAEVVIADTVYEGVVSGINRMAQTDNSDKTKVQAEVHIVDSDSSMILGIEADVTIYTQEKEAAVLLSREAVYTDDDGDYCYVIRDGKIAKQYVTVGILTDEQAEIAEGITTEDVVITDAVTDDKIGEKANAVLN